MKYMGSKGRIAKHILPIILKDRTEGQWYVEPMVGGANMIDKVEGNRIANDSNHFIISLFKKVVSGWVPRHVSKDLWCSIKKNINNYPAYLVGWAGTGCSYSGVWLSGFAGVTETKGGLRDYQSESIRSILKQKDKLTGVVFYSGSYLELIIPEKSIIYCDPPYENTAGYKDKFNSIEFWEWCRQMTIKGHTVFISEYNAPEDFECVWEMTLTSSLSANGKSGGNKTSVEKLFTYKLS